MFTEVLSWPRPQSPDVKASKTKPSVTIVPGRGTPPIAGQEATAHRRLCGRGPLPSCAPREVGQTVPQGPPSPRAKAAQPLPLSGPPRTFSELPTAPSPSPAQVRGWDGFLPIREVRGTILPHLLFPAVLPSAGALASRTFSRGRRRGGVCAHRSRLALLSPSSLQKEQRLLLKGARVYTPLKG